MATERGCHECAGDGKHMAFHTFALSSTRAQPEPEAKSVLSTDDVRDADRPGAPACQRSRERQETATTSKQQRPRQRREQHRRPQGQEAEARVAVSVRPTTSPPSLWPLLPSHHTAPPSPSHLHACRVAASAPGAPEHHRGGYSHALFSPGCQRAVDGREGIRLSIPSKSLYRSTRHGHEQCYFGLR